MEPLRGFDAIVIPFQGQDHYREVVDDLDALRALIDLHFTTHPEAFPPSFSGGYTFHDVRKSTRLQVRIRRLKLKSDGRVVLLRPSCILPYCVAWTHQMQAALTLHLSGESFDAIEQALDLKCKTIERAQSRLGTLCLVGTTLKSAEKLPEHLVSDEKHTRLKGKRVYLATTVALGCILGAEVVQSASRLALRHAYGVFAKEALALAPDYTPRSVCLDGWRATHQAWLHWFPNISIILCFLHSALALKNLCMKRWGEFQDQLIHKLWEVYHAESKASFSQRLRRLAEWVEQEAPCTQSGDQVRLKMARVLDKKDMFTAAYAHEQSARTSNQVDRLMNQQDKNLYAQKYYHGTLKGAVRVARAQGLIWNFHEYGPRSKRRNPEKHSAFEQANGFVYHTKWLHNLYCAASCSGASAA